MRPSRNARILAVGAGLLACWLGVSLAEPPPTADPAPSLKDLQKQRVEVLTERVALARKANKSGVGITDELRFLEERLAIATAEMEGKAAELRKLYERRLETIRAAEAAAEKSQKAGGGALAEVLAVRELRLEVEIALARLKSEKRD